jgi:hypothetical protein
LLFYAVCGFGLGDRDFRREIKEAIIRKIELFILWDAGLSGLNATQPKAKSFANQPRQPLPGVLDFGMTGVSIFPEVEEFLVPL